MQAQLKHACVIMCYKFSVTHAPYEIAGKRKRWDAIKHLLIAKALREAFNNDTSGRCGCSSTSTINTATIDAACGLYFAPKLKEFLYVASAKFKIVYKMMNKFH